MRNLSKKWMIDEGVHQNYDKVGQKLLKVRPLNQMSPTVTSRVIIRRSKQVPQKETSIITSWTIHAALTRQVRLPSQRSRSIEGI